MTPDEGRKGVAITDTLDGAPPRRAMTPDIERAIRASCDLNIPNSVCSYPACRASANCAAHERVVLAVLEALVEPSDAAVAAGIRASCDLNVPNSVCSYPACRTNANCAAHERVVVAVLSERDGTSRKETLEEAAETVHAMDPAHYVRWGSDAAATALDTAEDRIRALIDKPPAPSDD